LTLDEFLGLLPIADPLPIVLDKAKREQYGVEEPTPYPLFVPPGLNRVSASAGPYSVILISAPGAVGKTTLAREIAWRIGSPLWHLGQVNVGSDFFGGTIARTYGSSEYARVYDELVSGKRAVVLDGLDEARLRAGDQNFEAFLESLADDFRTPGQHPAIVLLGRTDTVSDTAIWFELHGVPAVHYEIEYFDRQSAVAFISKYLDARSKEKPHLGAPDSFALARDAVLDRLERAVPEGVHPLSLAGYAPVLELISHFLDVGNPYAEYRRILSDSKKWRLETLVGDIAKKLLDREHEKTVTKLAAALGAHPPGSFQWGAAYQPDEQCLRLLAVQTRFTLTNPPPADLPSALREPYERKLKQWVQDHPFMAQPLFMDYAYA
jgi:hypothetical protein